MQTQARYRATIFFVAKQDSGNIVAFLPFQETGSGKRKKRSHVPFIQESTEEITTELINQISEAEWGVTGKAVPTLYPDLFVFEVKSGYPNLPLGENGGVVLVNHGRFIDTMHKIADQLPHGIDTAEKVQEVVDGLTHQASAA